MKLTGKDIIEAVANRLTEENIRCYDSAIVKKIGSLDCYQLNQLTSFGDVTQWKNDRINKEREE